MSSPTVCTMHLDIAIDYGSLAKMTMRLTSMQDELKRTAGNFMLSDLRRFQASASYCVFVNSCRNAQQSRSYLLLKTSYKAKR